MNPIDATFDSDPGLDDAIRAMDGGTLNATMVVVTDNVYKRGVVYGIPFWAAGPGAGPALTDNASTFG